MTAGIATPTQLRPIPAIGIALPELVMSLWLSSNRSPLTAVMALAVLWGNGCSDDDGSPASPTDGEGDWVQTASIEADRVMVFNGVPAEQSWGASLIFEANAT